ncbi:MAG: pirin family protein [Thermoplasmatota archaeon]
MDYKIIEPEEKHEGKGAKVKRLFPTKYFSHLDPFVLLDEFFVESDKGFPTHPHGGFEAITYMVDGYFRHKDNLGNDSTIGPGGLQRFTAGHRIEHSEMPRKGKACHGFQLWINLPKRLKDIEPSYQKVDSDVIPDKKISDGNIKILVGDNSPTKLNTDVLYQDIHLRERSSLEIKLSKNHNNLFYIYRGKITIDNFADLGRSTGFIPRDIDKITIESDEGGRLLFISGKPHNQKINLRGSFVE